MKTKRLGAFIIDLLVVGLFLMIVYYFVPIKDASNIEQNVANLSEQVLNNEIGKLDYYKEFSKNMYALDSDRVLYTAFNTLIVILYFLIIPIITNGRTLGMYITGIKLKGKLNINNMFLRNLIATGLLYLICSVLLVYLTKDVTYFSILGILGIIQFLLVIISTFMVIYRSDSKGIQDIISNTEIVLNKEVKK